MITPPQQSGLLALLFQLYMAAADDDSPTMSGTTCSGGPQLHLANQLHLSSSTRCVAIVAVQYGPRVSPDHVVTIIATSVAHPVLLHLRHPMLQQRAQLLPLSRQNRKSDRQERPALNHVVAKSSHARGEPDDGD